MAESYISDIQLGIQTGTDRTFYVTWQCSKASDTENYTVRWWYFTGDRDDDDNKMIWFLGAENTTEVLQNTWSPPVNAAEIRLNIKANAKTTTSNGKETPKFTSGWTADSATGAKYTLQEVTASANNTIKNLSIGIQTGTDRTFFITWKGGRVEETENYAVKWYYDTGDKVWFVGQESTTSTEDKVSTWTPPDNAKKIKANVTAVAKTHSVDGIEVPYFADDHSYDALYTLKAPDPPDFQISRLMVGLMTGTNDTVYASWTCTDKNGSNLASQTENYSVKWWYATGDDQVTGGWLWFFGEESDVDVKQATWTPPENAKKIKFQVQANPKTHFVNGVEVPYYDTGWTDAFFPLVPDKPTDYLISDVTIGIQSGTTDTLYTVWTCSKSAAQVENYTVRWSYGTGDGIWFIGNESEVDVKQSTYTPPSNATRVKFNVKANPKTYYSNGKETTYFVGKWSSDLVYRIEERPIPETPPTPTVTINGFGLTAEVNLSDENTELVQFEVARNDTEVVHTQRVYVHTLHAEMYLRVSAGNEYKVRCRGINSYSGTNFWNTEELGETRKNDTLKNDETYSEWSEYSENVGTQPKGTTITNIKTRWSTMGVAVYWDTVSGAESYEIQYAVNPMYFGVNDSEVSSVTVDHPNDHAEILGLDTGINWAFRIRVTNANGTSGWSKSTRFILGRAPVAPTTWSETTSVVIGDPARLFWVHNSQDGSEQTAAQLELTINNRTTTVTLTTETNYSFATSSYSQGATLKWRARTKGITEDYGPWSTQRVVTLYAPPVLELTSPSSDTVKRFPINVVASASPNSQTAISYYLEILALNSYSREDNAGRRITIKSGSQIYQKYFNASTSNPNSFSEAISVGDVYLENNRNYLLRLTVGMNSGLTAKVSRRFKVSWSEIDYVPNARVRIEPDTLRAVINPYCEDKYGNLVPNIKLSVYRREYDGSFTELATDLDNTEQIYICDPHPALDYARYRIVVTQNVTGNISYTDLAGVVVGEPSIVIQWDEEWSYYNVDSPDEMEEPDWSGSMVKLPYNVDISDSYNPDVNLVNYIGREHPVSYYGTQRGVTASWSTAIPADDDETLYSLRRLAVYQGDVYVREPSGVGYWAQVTVSFSKNHLETTIPVTLSVTRVEGGK